MREVHGRLRRETEPNRAQNQIGAKNQEKILGQGRIARLVGVAALIFGGVLLNLLRYGTR